MPGLGLIYDAVSDEWVLELSGSSCSSANESTPTTPNTSNELYCGRKESSSATASSLSNDDSNNNGSHDSTTTTPTRSNDDSSNNASHHDSTTTTIPTKRKRWSPKLVKRSRSTAPYMAHLVTCHGHGKLWDVVKAGCLACFKPNKGSNNNIRNHKGRDSRVVPIHTRSRSADAREQDLKAAIQYCKDSMVAH